MKRCSQCQKEKPESEFYKDSTKKNGFRSECKLCRVAYDKACWLANKEKKAARSKAYYLANKKKLTARGKVYRLANKEKVVAYRKAHRKINGEKMNAACMAWYAANKEKVAAYRKANRDKCNAACRKRRALKLGNTHEPYTESYIFERDGWVCQICGQKIDKKLKWPTPLSKSIDHIIPLNKGGDDAPTNVQAAHLRCNMRKYTKAGGQLRLIG